MSIPYEEKETQEINLKENQPGQSSFSNEQVATSGQKLKKSRK